MRRREFLEAAGLATAGAVLGSPAVSAYRGGAAGSEGRCAAGNRPNILLIMTDQQFADAMSCRVGDTHINTPAMDGLARSGTLFERAYCANPLCVPSRTSMFTGRYPHETGVQTNGKRKVDPEEFPCMGTIFKEGGYDTGFVGKWHMPFARAKTAEHGFDGGQLGRAGIYSAAPAIEFIEKKRSKPFLLVASFMNPHNICQWARGEKLPGGPIGQPPPPQRCPPPKPNRLPPRDETDTMTVMRRSFQSTRMFPVGDFDDDKWRQYIWAYYRMIEKVDAHIGKILGALRETGQEEDTLVVFTSDHGDCHGAHRWNQKTVFYDESARVPLIVSHKGVTRVGTSDRLVQTGVDLIPTLCDYGGVPVPEGLNGRSVKPILGGDEPGDWREYVVVSNKMVQGAPVEGESPQPDGRMVRSDRYKYCLYNYGRRRESLVDMAGDSGEMVNQARNSEFRDVLQRHRRHLKEFAERTADRLALTMLSRSGGQEDPAD